MIFVKFKIQYGDCELYDYSWFKDYGKAHYENGEFITDKDMIREVYGEEDEEIFEDNFDEDTNKYTDYNDDAIYYSVSTYLKMKDLDSANKFLLSNKNNFYNKSNYDKVQKIIDNYSLDKKSYEYIPGILGGIYLLQLGLE